jgi:hypothetical protein
LLCSGNQLATLDVSSNTALTYFDCSDNQLATLDVSANTALELLYCEDNQLATLEVSSNTALIELICGSNQLASLDVSANTSLTHLESQTNQLTSLDVSANIALTFLACDYNNQLTNLDVSLNIALAFLGTEDNQLTTLDVSSNTALTELFCGGNQLTYLNMRNGVTDALTTFDATDNSLTCIETLDPAYATANWTYANDNIDDGVTFADICYASNPSYTNVPDDNFEQALINLGYDDTLDDYVVTDSISSVTYLNVAGNEISDLTGIEGFTALTYLQCEQNQLTSLDVGSNTALTILHCSSNQLTSLDMSANTALTYLRCDYNQLTSLDMSANTALTYLRCDYNQLTSLDMSANTALTELDCQANQLTSLDLSSNTALTYLHCVDNQLTSLDVSANTALTYLDCNNNQLTSLDVSSNTSLDNLQCYENQLTTLDVSNNTALTNLRCYENQLTSLDVGSNTALTELNCNENQLTSLDVSTNTALTHLYFGGNQLTSLDVSSNTALLDLNFPDNQLTSLDVSSNTALFWLNCAQNQLTSLDVSSNTALTGLLCSNNQLTYLNMKNGVTDAYTHFSAQTNDLTCIETLDPAYATTNWTSANGNIDADVTFAVICGSEAQTNWYVATTGSDASGSGTSASPLASIQTAINATTDGDTVSVAAGTYVENINFNGKNIAVIGADSSNTIIDGDSSGSVVLFNSGEDSTAILKKFTLKNGFASSTEVFLDMGGGVLCVGSSPTLSELIIANNSTTGWGGGITMYNSNAKLSNSIVRNNSTTWLGGGGMVIQSHSYAKITNVKIIDNLSGSGGGGISCANSSPVLKNVLIMGNNVGSFNEGGGMEIGGPSDTPTLINVTITKNTATGQPAGGIMFSGGSANIINSIIVDNYPQDINFNSGASASTINVSYSYLEGGLDSIITNNNGTVTWGSGNIDLDPHFVDPENGDYHLADWSPCIGTGLDTSIVSSTDIEGNPRPNPAGSNPDMGAYENALGAPIEHIVITPDTLLVTEDSLATVDFRENDLVLNAIALFLSIIDSSSHGTISVAGDTMLTYTPMADFFGYDTVQYALSGTIAADTGFVFITVVNEDDMPVVVNAIPDITVNEDAPDSLLANLDVVFMDIDDELEYSHVIVDTTLVFASVTNDSVTLQFLPDANGSTVIIFTATNPTIRASVSDTLTVILLPVNDAPIAAVYPDTSILEDDTLTVMFSATDVDEDSLSFGVAGPTDNPDITVSNLGAGFNVFASPNWHGDAEIRIDVWDGALADTAYFTLTVNPVNDAPAISALADTTINEDATIEIVLTASDIDEDTLTFSATADTSAVIVAMNTDTLSVSLVDNWNGSSSIMVVVSDGSATDTTSFELTVNAVNDAPSSFALNEQDSVYITMNNFDSDSLTFGWDESADVDEDELTYHFTAELIINGQLTTEYDTTLTANEMKIDYKSVFDEIYAAQAMLAVMEWDVSVSDGIAEVLAENGPLTVGVNASDAVLSIDEELLPDVYALHQNYPNPFNPITTLRYDLPEQANVNIIIYNLLGRQVRTLLNQTQDAGYRSVIWNATNDYGKPVSAGVYLYQIQAGEFVQTRKMVLLK